MSTNTKTMGRDEAVKVLRGYSQQHGNPEDFDLAIAALQAQGEPVAWVIPEEINNLAWHDGHTTPGIKPYSTDERTLPLYTHPAPQQPAALRIVEPVLNRATPGTREAEMAVLETDENGVPTIWCDPEIADLVRALNVGGVRTVASCSGHGERLGSIALADGRALVICSSPDEAIAVIRSHEDQQPASAAGVEGWFLPASSINSLQRESVDAQIKRCKAAHFTNLDIRINGQNEAHEADWIKHMVKVATPKPAAVDEAMVERAVAAAMSAPVGISMKSYVRIVLEAALATQHREPTHDRRD